MRSALTIVERWMRRKRWESSRCSSAFMVSRMRCVSAPGNGLDCAAYGARQFPEGLAPLRRLLGRLRLFLAALLFAVFMEVTR